MRGKSNSWILSRRNLRVKKGINVIGIVSWGG